MQERIQQLRELAKRASETSSGFVAQQQVVAALALIADELEYLRGMVGPPK